ncbi:TetR/AcrR family transcriptional regulator [Nesterenkonia muleiensis]|uniref:TetR/AcrR family transcriptional regulator n=1 Tax=Nesterenkonia muleiensis TaxID=2282648 RepID=UPI000E75BE60|nr:TetR/AcrR family transcriptional regulator [Nesterenkonia muleiensis]
MPRASAAAAAQTAKDILTAASDLFSTHGFAAVSIDHIARQAGVTRGAVYHHYGSKLGLFSATAEQLQAKVAHTVVTEAEAAGHDAVAQLRAGCHAFLETITSESAARILLAEAPAVLGWSQWRQMDAENSVVHLREALKNAGTPRHLLEAATAQLSGAMNEAALWIVESSGAHHRDAAHQTLDLLIDAALS